MALAEIFQTVVTETPVVPAFTDVSLPEFMDDEDLDLGDEVLTGLPPNNSVSMFVAGALNVWYAVDYAHDFETCFVGSRPLTRIFNRAINAYAHGRIHAFIRLQKQAYIHLPFYLEPCAHEYEDVAATFH